jgi:ribosomal protein S18 acetylase RimI-like enzyme
MVRIERDLSDGIVVATDLHTHDRVGIAFYDDHGDQGVIINWLSTDPSARRRGVATQILDYIRDNINPHIVLGTQSYNPDARAFYKAYGFKEKRSCRLERSSLVLDYGGGS